MTEAECDVLCRSLRALQRKDEVRMIKNAKAKGSRRERQARMILGSVKK